jgi:hypothetical protein
MFKVFSETHGNLLNVTPYKQITYFQHTMHGIYITNPKAGTREQGEDILDQDQKPNSAPPCLMAKHSSNLQLPSALLTATHFSLLCSSPWQVSHDSGISNILGSPMKSRLHLHSFTCSYTGFYTMSTSYHAPFWGLLCLLVFVCFETGLHTVTWASLELKEILSSSSDMTGYEPPCLECWLVLCQLYISLLRLGCECASSGKTEHQLGTCSNRTDS